MSLRRIAGVLRMFTRPSHASFRPLGERICHASLIHRDLCVALGLAGIVVLLGAWQMVVGVCGVYHDDAIYVITAKAMAEGDGYKLINLPNAPFQTKYPILYPALLALIWKFWPSFPDNLLAMQWLSLLLGASTVGLAYLYMVRCNYFSRSVVAAAALLSITSPQFLYFCSLTLSEIPFALVTVLAAWALDKYTAGPDRSGWLQFSLGVLLALPFLTRSIGIVFAPIGLALLYLSGRPVRWVFFGAAILMLPWISWMLLGSRWNDLEVTSYYTTYFSWWYNFGIGALSRVVLMNAMYLLYNSASIGLGIFDGQLFFPDSAWLLVLLAGSTVYLGLTKQLCEGRVLPCFLTGYLILVLVWPWFPSRFLIPILPFLLAYFLNLIWNQMQRLAVIAPHKMLGTIGLSIVLMSNITLVHRAVAISQSMHYPYLKRMKEPISWSSYEGIFKWIRMHTLRHDIIASGLDTMVYLYTNRPAFRPFVVRPMSLFYGDNSPPLGSKEEIIGFIKICKARYLVQTPMPKSSEEGMNEFVEQVQREYPGWLKLVYLGEDKRFAVFELQSDHEHDL